MSRNGTHCDEENFQIALLRVNRDATTKKDKENFDVSNEGPPYQSDVFSIAGVEKFFFFLGTWVEG
jgi:hypothetical protein